MKNYRKHIDDFFRERLGKYREVPPAEAWDELSVRLQTLKPYVPRSPYRWLWHAGMVSVITVFTVSLVKKLKKVSHDDVRVAATTTPVTAGKPEAITAQLDGTGTPGAEGSASAPTLLTDATGARETVAAPSGEITGNTTATQPSASSHAPRQMAFRPVVNKRRPAVSPSQPVQDETALQAHAGTSGTVELNNASITTGAQMPALNDLKTTVAAKKDEPGKNPEKIRKEAATIIPAVHHRTPLHFGFGIKAGYEYGATAGAAQKFVLAPYAQLQVSKKLSVLVQPAAKYAMVPDRTISSNTYYKITNGNQPAQLTGYTIETRPVIAGPEKTYYLSNYRYTQTYDSMVKTRHTGGSYMEFELPVMLQYGISRNISVYGGGYMAISRTTGLQETTVSTSITRTADTIIENEGALYAGPAPDLTQQIHHYGAPLSDYTTPAWVNQAETRIRFGYIAGLSYQYGSRWMVDALIQQSPLKPDVKEGYNVLVPLSSAYFRLSVGYKLK